MQQLSQTATLTSQIANPIITAAVEVFETMAMVKLRKQEVALLEGRTPFYPVTAVIQLSGRARGSVCLSLQRRTAFALVHRVLGESVNEVNGIVRDTVGEFANVIAGSAKDKLEQLQMELGLPNVVSGNDCRIGFPEYATPMKVTFASELGPLMVAFGFCLCE